MLESTRIESLRQRLSALGERAQKLPRHPRRHVVVNGALLVLLLVLIVFDVRSTAAALVAMAVVAIHLLSERKATAAGRTERPADERQVE